MIVSKTCKRGQGRIVAGLLLLFALFTSGCEPYFFQMAALRQYGGEGPPAAYDYTPITFSGPGCVDPETDKTVHTRNHAVNDRSIANVCGYLGTMRNLDLDLSYTDLTDAAVPFIRKLDLQKLDVSGTQITADALLQLRGKTKLGGLIFSMDHATEAEVAKLKDALKLPHPQRDDEDHSIYLSAEPITAGG